MLNAPEMQLVAAPPARLVHVEQDVVLASGLVEAVPKKINITKLTTTIARQCAQQHGHQNLRLRSFVPDPLALVQNAALFRDFYAVHAHPLTFASVIEEAFAENIDIAEQVLVLAGPHPAPNHKAHEPLARALSGVSRSFASEMIEHVMRGDESMGRGIAHTRRLVIEEKPGRALVIAPEENSLRQANKRGEAFMRRGAELGLFDAVPGWAGAGLVLRRQENSGTRKLNIGMASLNLGGAHLEYQHLTALIGFLPGWLSEQHGVNIAAIRCLELLVPYAEVAGFLRRELSKLHPRLAMALTKAPQFVYGWHPAAALFNALARFDTPFLLVHTGDFPRLHLLVGY